MLSLVHNTGMKSPRPVPHRRWFQLSLRSLLTLVPVAFVGYFPTAALLDKGASTTAGALTPVVAAACAAGAWAVFRAGLRRYESAGS